MISSVKNPKVADALRLRKRAMREQDRRFLVEGAQGVREALAAEPPAIRTLFVADPLEELAVAARSRGVEVIEAASAVLGRLSDTVTPQGLVGVAPFVDVPPGEIEPAGCAVILHEVRDPGNAGTIMRSADAAAAAGVVFTASSVDPYNPKTVRASAGSIFHLPLARGTATLETVQGFRARGVRILAMDARGAVPIARADLTGPIAFVFGNEANGLPPEVRAAADQTVRVPQPGRAESLNLAAAATVCLFEWVRRREDDDRLATLIAAAAHDIRSPLTAMKGFGHALERRWSSMTDEERSLMLRGIAHDVDRMDQTLRLLVDAGRLAAGVIEPYLDRVDLGALVEELAAQLALDPDHPSVIWSGDAGPYVVDRGRLTMALLAFDEALRWWASDGPILIEGRTVDGRLELHASRGGAAIDPQEVGSLFVPRRPGTGGGSKIGLYVVQRVAERLGGEATAVVADDRLRCTLRLPLG